MNVTLNLITEFEDIPNEVSHMLKFVQDELAFTARRTANVSAKLAQDEVDANEALDLLHSVRLQMAKIDTRMEDCMSILGGYQHYLENPPEEQPNDPVAEEENEEG
jgi:hypothetical protein|tara:strand:+ start:195 stop:512 length:318 start_codon:yes stop_codon:yes gene_type:complete